MNDHPMQPTPEQYGEWLAEACRLHPSGRFSDLTRNVTRHIAGLAYAAGADAELEACEEWLSGNVGRWEIPEELRESRRPNPLSLKQQALADLDTIQTHDIDGYQIADLSNIRRAIEALPEEQA